MLQYVGIDASTTVTTLTLPRPPLSVLDFVALTVQQCEPHSTNTQLIQPMKRNVKNVCLSLLLINLLVPELFF